MQCFAHTVRNRDGKTRINYDMLTYLPEDMDTVKGQNILLDDFGKGAFSLIVVEGMDEKDIADLTKKLEDVNHVDTVMWYSSLADISIPMEMLPENTTMHLITVILQ